MPSKETILSARDRILARFPKLRVVGAYLGSYAEDLKALAKRLDAYLNFGVDLAARLRHLLDVDRETLLQFLEKYQDRIIYGSDYVMGQAHDEQIATAPLVQANRDWSVFVNSGTVKLQDREVRALDLPNRMIRKIFRDNAVRWIPGIAPA